MGSITIKFEDVKYLKFALALPFRRTMNISIVHTSYELVRFLPKFSLELDEQKLILHKYIQYSLFKASRSLS